MQRALLLAAALIGPATAWPGYWNCNKWSAGNNPMGSSSLDKDGSDVVDYNDICDTYNASKHPAVLEGRKTERQVLEEFLATFEMALSGVADGIVTLEEFLEYYTSISASVDNDDYFE